MTKPQPKKDLDYTHVQEHHHTEGIYKRYIRNNFHCWTIQSSIKPSTIITLFLVPFCSIPFWVLAIAGITGNLWSWLLICQTAGSSVSLLMVSYPVLSQSHKVFHKGVTLDLFFSSYTLMTYIPISGTSSRALLFANDTKCLLGA